MKISILLPLLAGWALSPVPAVAAEPVNRAPTAQDWAAIASLPDLSGVWSPGPLDRFPPGSKTAPPWKPDQATQIAALQRQ